MNHNIKTWYLHILYQYMLVYAHTNKRVCVCAGLWFTNGESSSDSWTSLYTRNHKKPVTSFNVQAGQCWKLNA